MKRILLIGLYLFSCICLVAQTTKTYTLEFDETDFTIVSSNSGDMITSEKHQLKLDYDTLSPAIPHILTYILLPEDEVFRDFFIIFKNLTLNIMRHYVLCHALYL